MKGDWLKTFKEVHNLEFTKEDYKQWSAMVEQVLPLYKKYMKKNSRILDLGCGLGCIAIPLSHYFHVVALDKDERIIEYAKKNAKRFGGKIEFTAGDLRKIDEQFGKDSFDAVTSGGVMEHFTEDEIKELLEKQQYVAPNVFIHVPVGNAGKVTTKYGVERHLWPAEYWLKNILKGRNIVEYYTEKSSQKVGKFMELNIVLKR